MAIYETDTVIKGLRHRGPHAGKDFTVSGAYTVASGASLALTDSIRVLRLGENQRPIRLVLKWTPLSGTPVLTNATFDVGVIADTSTTFTRNDGTTYPVIPTDADILSADLAIDADNMATDVEIPRPVLDAVSNYGPFYVTLTPSGAGAFSVAGGSGQLALEVVTIGEQRPDALIYREYMNLKVANS